MCNLEKKFTEFTPRKTAKDGYRSQCKPCRNLIMQKWVDSHKDQVKEHKDRWYAENKEKKDEASKQWKLKNREKYLAQQRDAARSRYNSDVKKYRQACIDWRKNNPDVYKESEKKSKHKYYINNKSKLISKNLLWKSKNAVRVKELARKHTAQQRIKFPDRAKARIMVRCAIKMGYLIRPSYCSLCTIEGKIEGHHPDYSKPLEVIWLCKKCHMAEHRKKD
jgi:hypothetical protein